MGAIGRTLPLNTMRVSLRTFRRLRWFTRTCGSSVSIETARVSSDHSVTEPLSHALCLSRSAACSGYSRSELDASGCKRSSLNREISLAVRTISR